MKFKRAISLFMVFALLMVLVACGSPAEAETAPAVETEQSEPTTEDSSAADESMADEGVITIVDQRGETITFDAPPERVAIAVMPFPSVFYSVLGDNDYMVGCNPSPMEAYHDSALRYMYPTMAEANTDWIAANFVVNVEELMKLEPDVVIQWISQDKEIEKMEAAGIKFIGVELGEDPIEGVKTWVRMLGQMYNLEERSEEVIAHMDAAYEEVDEILADVAEADYPSIMALSNEAPTVSYATYWDRSKPYNVGSELTAEERASVDMEQIYAWDPDVIYIGNFTDLQPSDLFNNTIDGQDWSLVRAVQEGNVYKIPIGGYRWDPPSVENPLAIKWFAKTQYPELFADMDMREEVSEFYQTVYDFELTEEMLDEILNDTQN